MAVYDSIDLDFSWDGDYAIGDDGDLKDTTYDLLQSFKNELHNVLKCEFNDWELHPNLATNISEFNGEPNNRSTAEAIRERCKSRLIAAGLVLPEDIQIRVIPVAQSQVLVVLTINVIATPGNNLTVGDPLLVTFLYDTMESDIFFFESSKYQKDYIGRV